MSVAAGNPEIEREKKVVFEIVTTHTSKTFPKHRFWMLVAREKKNGKRNYSGKRIAREKISEQEVKVASKGDEGGSWF